MRYFMKSASKRREILEEEKEALEFIDKFSKKTVNWLKDDEERALFIEHYVEEIRLEVDKKHRCEKWVKEHFFEHFLILNFYFLNIILHVLILWECSYVSHLFVLFF